MNGGSPKQIEIVVLIWLIGLIVGEMQQVFIFQEKKSHCVLYAFT